MIKIKLEAENNLSKTGRKLSKPPQNLLKQLKCQSKEGTIEDYEFGELLGKGSYGEVYQAVHKATNKNYAIKVYDRYQMSQAHRLKNINNEIRIVKKLDHPNLVKLFTVYKTVAKIYLIMELVRGVALSNYLKENVKIDETECKKIFKQIVEGIDYLHSKLVCHRDIKLENIIITENGLIKIVDFGFAVKYSPNKKLTTV